VLIAVKCLTDLWPEVKYTDASELSAAALQSAHAADGRTGGNVRTAYRRTRWFVSDEAGDGVLFVASTGDYVIFDRLYVEAFDVHMMFLVDVPDTDTPFYSDVPDSDTDFNVLLMPCEVTLPPMPAIGTWVEAVAAAVAG
jgi:hypothetical protein